MEQLDLNLFWRINGASGSPSLDGLFLVLTIMGNKGGVWILLAMLLLLGAGRLPGWREAGARRWRGVGLVMLGALAVSWAMESGLKLLIARPRPPVALTGVQLLGTLPESYSFPSGHALSSFAAATVICVAIRWSEQRRAPLSGSLPGWALISLAWLISFSRIYVGHHYPADILAGALLGVLVGWGAWALFCRAVDRRGAARSSPNGFRSSH